MLVIKSSTKKGQNIIKTAMHFEGLHLYDVYGRFSSKKLQAFYSCRELCFKEGGEGFHICSHNDMTYSVAWFTKEGVRLETAYNSYFVPLENAIDLYFES